jgi:hypothetical protein
MSPHELTIRDWEIQRQTTEICSEKRIFNAGYRLGLMDIDPNLPVGDALGDIAEFLLEEMTNGVNETPRF